MRRVRFAGMSWLVLSSFMLVAGCSAPALPERPQTMPAIVLPKTVEAPGRLEATTLGLITESDRLHVGDSLEQVEKLFPAPSGSVAIKELPEAFGTRYEGYGFDTGTRSFGSIFFEDKLALAMIYRNAVKVVDSDLIMKSYKDAFGLPEQTVGKGPITYAFWEIQDQRLMICVSTDQKTNLRNLTISVGHKNMMSALRMGERYATNDVRNAEQLPDEKRSGE
ncbi:MAG: hypothetical protein ABL962_06230 [Fimbriimonadaceae bacterium]